MRAFKYFLLGSAGLLISAVIIALISAQNALDDDFQHSRQATELAPLTDTADDGLVKVEMGDYHYRARIAGFNDTDTLGITTQQPHLVDSSSNGCPLI